MSDPIHPISISGGQGNQAGAGNTQNNYYTVTLSQYAEDGKDSSGVIENLAASPLSMPSRLWNVPYPPNPFFTGREEILQQLEQALSSTQKVVLTQTQVANQQVISGLGGIGKTQTAIEYAYRHREQYRAVLWAQADNSTTLDIEFGRIATLLNLPEKDNQDVIAVRNAVRCWLESNRDYLLILDNADNPDILGAFLPPQLAGHLLLTSRAHSFGKINIFNPIQLLVLDEKESVTFLLRRTRRVEANVSERRSVLELAQELGFLPLALEQAGAYITEKQIQFSDYLTSFRKRKLDLLEKQGPETGGYNKTVATTWSLNLEAVEQESVAAAELLRLSAFLGPDRIPDELLVIGVPDYATEMAADPLFFAELLDPLARYSLIQRDGKACTYDIHRLVQEVIQYRMNEETRHVYAHLAVVLVGNVFPLADYTNWTLCKRLLPHALVCAEQIDFYLFASFQTANLLNATGYYLSERGQYFVAEPLLVGALKIREKVLGMEHPNTAHTLNNLASLYNKQGRYDEAEPLFLRALAIYENILGTDHLNTGTALNNLAGLYSNRGRYDQAAPLIVRALAIAEIQLGRDHPGTAISLNRLAGLYKDLHRYGEAEPLYKRVLAIREKEHGLEHPATARSLNNLGILYYSEGRYEKAEPLLVQALAIREAILGPEDLETATSLKNLGNVYSHLNRLEEARSFHKRALAIYRGKLPPEHPNIASSLEDIGGSYLMQNLCAEAEPLLAQALAIYEKVYQPGHPRITIVRLYYDTIQQRLNKL